MKKNKKILIPVLAVALVLLLIEGITYAWLVWRGNGDEIQKIKGGTLELELDDLTSQGISIDPAIPMSNRQGLETTAYTFTVRNKGSLNASYVLYLEDEELEQGQTRISDQYVKYSITKNNSAENALDLTSSINADNKRKIADTIINSGGIDSYTLRLWINGNATNDQIANKVFKAKIKLEASQTGESSAELAVISGAGQEVAAGEETVFSFNKVDASFGSSGKVYIDGEEINKDNYTVEVEGETTKIKVNGSYSENLSEGAHALKVEFSDGEEITTTFTVSGKLIIVTYNRTTNGGSGSSSSKGVRSGEAIDLSLTASKEGYEFIGWNTDKNAEEGLNSITAGDKSITLYAIYGKEITATFTKGENVTSLSSEEESCTLYNNKTKCSISLPEIIPNTRYRAKGFYKGETKFEGDEISSNVELEARTEFGGYNVEYDYATNGGSSATKLTDEVDYGTAVDLTPTATNAKEGYEFIGWNTDKNAHTGLNSLTMGNKDIVLYAIYKSSSIDLTATFYKNGVERQSVNNLQNTTYTTEETVERTCTIAAVYNNEEQDETCTVNAPYFASITGYIKNGYGTSANAREKAVNENGSIELSDNNSVYYALQYKTVTITYTNGGEGIASIGRLTDSCTLYGSDTSCTIPSSNLPKITAEQNGDSVVILGWYNEDNENIGESEGEYLADSNVISSNKTYTAKAVVYSNSHIKAAYTYNENDEASNFCLGGEEEACQIRSLRSSDTVPTGTIIKYEVKNGTELYFNVLYDKGDTLIMQQKNSTTGSVEWASSGVSTSGPTTALATLQSATSSWNYVNNQTYQMGTTVFGTGTFASNKTGLRYNEGDSGIPSENLYTMSSRTVKARMITAQEASELGCKMDAINSDSCKKFLGNYLYDSTSYGGTVNDGGSRAYWTMTAQLDCTDGAYGTNAIDISPYAITEWGFTTRAVVVVNK